MSKKKRITAVFGGTFDPPHNGHIHLATQIIRKGKADNVMFIPALNPPHKPDLPISSFEDRFAMTEIAASAVDSCQVSKIEAERKNKPSYTFETMSNLSERYPSHKFLLLIGLDSLLAIDTWYKAAELIQKWGIITYPRNNDCPDDRHILEELTKKWDKPVAYLLLQSILKADIYDISSTEIREKIRQELNVSDYISPEVYNYIKEKGLYKSD